MPTTKKLLVDHLVLLLQQAENLREALMSAFHAARVTANELAKIDSEDGRIKRIRELIADNDIHNAFETAKDMAAEELIKEIRDATE